MWHEYLAQYFRNYDYPEAGAKALLGALDQALDHNTLGPALLAAVDSYEQTNPREQEAVMALLEQVRGAAAQAAFSTQTMDLLFFLMCMKHLKVRYQGENLPMAYYDGIAADLRSKLNECFGLKGFWGTISGSWFCRFFSLGRFVIGRLQYEYIPFPAAYCNEALLHLAGQAVVNTHIPSGKPLHQQEVQASLAEAAAFFAPLFPDRNVLFICHSWLLFPGHREMLPETSGIRRFMEEFEIVKSFPYPRKQDLWRIFYVETFDDPDTLPQETSLQRAYVRWLKDGKDVGGGLGLRRIQA